MALETEKRMLGRIIKWAAVGWLLKRIFGRKRR
jgi:hypothetical protein